MKQVDPDILSGTPVFAGTRVPVQTLLEYLEQGVSLAEFLADFPTVTQDQAIAALQEAKDALLGRVQPPAYSAVELLDSWLTGESPDPAASRDQHAVRQILGEHSVPAIGGFQLPGV